MAKRKPARRRCPRCNQLLRLEDGEIERHMEPPMPNGPRPKECITRRPETPMAKRKTFERGQAVLVRGVGRDEWVRYSYIALVPTLRGDRHQVTHYGGLVRFVADDLIRHTRKEIK